MPTGQSDCWVQGLTHTGLLPMTTALHSIDWQSESMVQSDPSERPGGGPMPPMPPMPPLPVVAPPVPMVVVLVVLVVLVVVVLMVDVVPPIPLVVVEVPDPPDPVNPPVTLLASPDAHPTSPPRPTRTAMPESKRPCCMLQG